jgi:hypothetical protein
MDDISSPTNLESLSAQSRPVARRLFWLLGRIRGDVQRLVRLLAFSRTVFQPISGFFSRHCAKFPKGWHTLGLAVLSKNRKLHKLFMVLQN